MVGFGVFGEFGTSGLKIGAPQKCQIQPRHIEPRELIPSERIENQDGQSVASVFGRVDSFLLVLLSISPFLMRLLEVPASSLPLTFCLRLSVGRWL